MTILQRITYNLILLSNLQLIIIQTMSDSNQFLKIAHRASRSSDFQQIVQQQQDKLELLPFRINQLTPEKAIKTYLRIQNKYDGPNRLNVHAQTWLESQKRLFAWFIVFYTYFNRDHTGDFSIIDFSNLAPSLFHKDADFLLFHYLTLIKSSDKFTWNQDKDQLVLSAINQQGLKWNEVSRKVFMKTAKKILIPPKSCRQRWLNHLDHTKFKGKWNRKEDLIIFEHVVQTKSKKWSKMVNLFGNKRSQHSIKNRFNTLISKHRHYKSEKEIKVAVRVLSFLKQNQQFNDILQDRYSNEQSQQRQKNILVNINQFARFQQKHLDKCQDDDNQLKSIIDQHQIADKPEQIGQIMIKQQQYSDNQHELNAFSKELQIENKEAPQERAFPFEKYNYEKDICPYESNIYNYQTHIFDYSQFFYYQPIFTVSIPTADTISRQNKIQQERQRRRLINNQL